MPNTAADSWGILLIPGALNRGIRAPDAQCEGIMEEIKKAARERGKNMGLT